MLGCSKWLQRRFSSLNPGGSMNHTTDKLQLLTEMLPKAMLQALTAEALEAVPSVARHGDKVAIYDFPFKVGRESRVMKVNGRLESIERPKKDNSSPSNDLYLVDRGQRLNISREHFEIRCEESGYSLVDRGSACGTRVAGSTIGGDDHGGIAPLRDGDIIAVGIVDTPYTYRFITFDDFSLVRTDC
jgi:hypothetical protein